MLDLFRFTEENQEMCRILLSPNGDMNFPHRLFEVIREKCRTVKMEQTGDTREEDFDCRYSFAILGVQD